MTRRDTSLGPDPLVEIGDNREWIDLEPYRELVRVASLGEPVALVTVIGSSGSVPRGTGAVMVVRGDGTITGTVGGGSLEKAMIEEALASMRDGRARRFHFDFSGGKDQNLVKACIGKADFLVQPLVPRPRLLVFGAGHVGQALAPIASTAGFEVTVIDDRQGYPDPRLFPTASRILHGPLGETIPELRFDPSTFVVVVTYGHVQDEEVVRACLPLPWAYLGVIGSRAKVARLRKNLGVDEASRALLSRIHAPIGLPLGGRTPGEIAVGIVAELVSVRHGCRPYADADPLADPPPLSPAQARE